MIKLSCVLPSYKDPYLFKTIADALNKSELGEALEIIAVFDGYWPTEGIIEDPRVRYIHHGQNKGMREAINTGVRASRGEFFMRLDEHCLFGKGFDRILTSDCKENEIMTARRYFLDPIKWEVMTGEGFVDYEKLAIQNVSDTVRKFAGRPWRERTEKRKDVMIDETQAMQGSMWIMPRKWWDTHIKELQTEGYGPLIQDSVEVCMKTWKAGGRLMLNKNTWFAHKHRSFKRTHNNGTAENPANCDGGYTYALQQWEIYYRQVLLPQWETSMPQ
jgi:glycosyltransferase involved in cell wall biosynthesis